MKNTGKEKFGDDNFSTHSNCITTHSLSPSGAWLWRKFNILRTIVSTSLPLTKVSHWLEIVWKIVTDQKSGIHDLGDLGL